MRVRGPLKDAARHLRQLGCPTLVNNIKRANRGMDVMRHIAALDLERLVQEALDALQRGTADSLDRDECAPRPSSIRSMGVGRAGENDQGTVGNGDCDDKVEELVGKTRHDDSKFRHLEAMAQDGAEVRSQIWRRLDHLAA